MMVRMLARLRKQLQRLHRTATNTAQGFTLVELMVVASLSVMLMLTVTSVFLTFFISDARTEVIGEITDEGDYALSQMEFLLRNAVSLEENAGGNICQPGMSEIRVRSFDNGITILRAATDSDGERYIASNGARLTSPAVTLTDPSQLARGANPVFICRRSTDGTTTFIDIEFTLQRDAVDFQEGSAVSRESFETGVTMRSR